MSVMKSETTLLRTSTSHSRMRASEVHPPQAAISYPEPTNFLRRMLGENEGLWKGLVLKVRK